MHAGDVVAPDRRDAIRARYAGSPVVPCAYATVRDYVDSLDAFPALARYCHDIKDSQRPWVLKNVLASVPAGGRVLEIGAGHPIVADTLAAFGYEVWVVDPYDGTANGPTAFDDLAAAYPRVRFVRDRFADHLDLGRLSFDAVCSISVLEHVHGEELDSLFRAADYHLKPGSGRHIHAVDCVVLGQATEFHLDQVRRVAALTRCPDGMADEVLARVHHDPDVYFLSAYAHYLWSGKGAVPYDQFPMRRVASLNFNVPHSPRL